METFRLVLYHTFTGALVGGVNFWFAWFFFKEIEDRRGMWVAGLVSIGITAAALGVWALRSVELGDVAYDSFVFGWLSVLLAGMTVATVIRSRTLV